MQLRRFAVIGHPIGHTMSPFIHDRLFSLTGHKPEYSVLDVPSLTQALPALRTVMAAAVAYTAVYRFCTLFAMEPYLQGMNPSLYYTVSRLVQFWM